VASVPSVVITSVSRESGCVYSWITLTTDFGGADGYVAACVGVIARIAPGVQVVDVSHDLPPGAIRRGATVLARVVPYWPPAVHVAVVDPGVGTARRALAVIAGHSVLIGPDNGLLLPAAEALGGVTEVVELTNTSLWLPSVSATFHGRDVFSPVAAHLANGLPLRETGSPVTDLVRLPEPERGEVVDVDRFGNLAVAGVLPEADVAHVNGVPARVGKSYGDVGPGELVVHLDSDGRLAIACRDGSAAHLLGVDVGSRLHIAW
jgi:S-adenosylmethionine hydrolase